MSCVIEHRSQTNTVFVAHNKRGGVGVIRIEGIDIELELNNVFLTVGDIELADARLKISGVRSHRKSDRSRVCHTGQERCVRLFNIRGLENALEFGTVNAGILLKHLIAECRGCTCLNAEVLIAVFIKMISAVRPVKVVGH